MKNILKRMVFALVVSFFYAFSLSAQINITGTVTDNTGETMPGVNVTVKGTTRGTTTDVDGKYTISVPDGNTVLTYSFIGYAAQEFIVGDRRTIDVTLSEDATEIGEVVISAFGSTQKKESVVGAVQSIRPAELQMPSANLSNAFAGRIAGVVAFQRSGQPGSNASEFYIRGISTLSGVTSPLIILDGVEISQGDLNALDPEVIEGFSILKDATATAMYGTRGANGVMIVKTKSGANLEKPQIGIRFETYINTPTKIPKFVDGYRYMEMYNEAVSGEKTGNSLFTQEQINNTRNGVNPYVYPNVDWYDEIFKDMSVSQKANFNIRGGTSRIVYYMNVGVTHETGMLHERAAELFSYENNIDLMKYAFQNNIDFHMTSTSTISLHLNAQMNSLRSPNTSVGDIYNAIMQSNPVDFPISYPADGLNNWIYWGAYAGGNDQGAVNPMASLTNGYKNMFDSKVIANIDFNQKLDFITEGLSFKTMFSYAYYGRTDVNRLQGINRYYLRGYTLEDNGIYTLDVQPFGTSLPQKPTLATSSSVSGDRRIYFQSYFNYDRRFGDHGVSAMTVAHLDQLDNNYPQTDLVASLPRRKLGFAARVSYDYSYRYLIELNAGYNGSENFAEGHRFGFFPSVAVGWNLSRESFWTPLMPTVSNLKLRASYGLVGNDQVRDADGYAVRYIYQSDIGLTGSPSYTTGATSRETYSGPKYNRYENIDLTWEVGNKFNAGIDLQLFNSLNIVVDAFHERRHDIFQTRGTIPNYLGVSGTVVYGNLAEVVNKGIDFSVNYGKQITDDLAVQFQGSFTFARNRVMEYDEAPGVRPALAMKGRRLNSIFGYVSNGLYLDEADIARTPTSTIGNIAIAPGDIKYVDQPNADGEYDKRITSDDRVAMGHPTIPEIVYGFGPSVSYKNWDFSVYFQGVANTSLMMSGFGPFGTQYNRNVLQFIADDYWSVYNQNPDAKYPRVTKNDNNHNTAASDFWLRNGAFLKLKNAEIGYTYKAFRFYVSGVNLLTFSPFKYWDPEMGGGKGLSYPTQRTFNIGIQMKIINQ